MILKIAFICDEDSNFLREIKIDGDATFLDLNKAILDTCGYTDDQITSFYLCDEDWRQGDQITREDMGVSSSEHDVYVMEKVSLREFVCEKDQKMVYVFDPFNDRVFYLQVMEITSGKQDEFQCVRSRGEAPAQICEVTVPTSSNDNLLDDEDSIFYGSDEFNEDEFDPEGFEIEE